MSDESKSKGKVTVEVEQTDDGISINLSGLGALKDLRELCESLCSCNVSCCSPRTAKETSLLGACDTVGSCGSPKGESRSPMS